jgi:serine phosphatase RsbU (regulator of sigma subunit)
MTDAEFTLHEGDLLVLYSDGAVEAMNARSEQFGVERLCGVVDSCVAESPQAICAAVVEHVRAWAPSQADDISILVARQRRA